MRKRKRTYPPAKTANRSTPGGPTTGDPAVRSTVASIDSRAVKGRPGLEVGGRVRVLGSGRHAGALATIERLVRGGIPQAIVRTDAGEREHVRTIDLEPVTDQGPA